MWRSILATFAVAAADDFAKKEEEQLMLTLKRKRHAEVLEQKNEPSTEKLLQTDNVRTDSESGVLTPYEHNPILIATTDAIKQGQGNCYAPDVHYIGETSPKYVMWYGCQGDYKLDGGHDRIYWSWSDNLVDWWKYPDDFSPEAALDAGTSNHVNDPSVVYNSATGKWMMYYTDASVGEQDTVWLAESDHYNNFQKWGMVIDLGVEGTNTEWEMHKVGRPSVILEDGKFKMWYDGQKDGQRHMGYATSDDGYTWTKYSGNPVLHRQGAADVKKVGDEYWLVAEGHQGIPLFKSDDGINWPQSGYHYVKISGEAHDAYGMVTPQLFLKEGELHSLWYAGASVKTWNKNAISAAFVGTAEHGRGGCTGCTPEGVSCPTLCGKVLRKFDGGVCGRPGSTDGRACCACNDGNVDNDGCSGNCHVECTGQGKDGGFCASGNCMCF